VIYAWVTSGAAILNSFVLSTIGDQTVDVPFSITITAKDQYGATFTGYSGTNTLSVSGGGTIDPLTTTAFTSGVWTGQVTLDTVGTGVSISTSGGGKSGLSNNFNVSSATLVFDHFTISGYPTSVLSGQSFGGVVVTACYQNGDPVQNYTGSVYFVSSDPDIVLPYMLGFPYIFTSGVGGDNGQHTFNDFMLKTLGTQWIRVTDGTVSRDSSLITVNANSPVLGTIGSKTVDELSPLTFTATATDLDLPAQTLTFSLQGSPPSGASITSGGVFTWTPTEAQGPGDYSITVRVTDNSSPTLYDEEIVSVRVNEIHVPFGLDGSNSGVTSGGGDRTITLTLRTTYPNDVLYISVTENDAREVTGITSTGLTWSLRATATRTSGVKVETWYAVKTDSGSTAITISFDDMTNGAAVAFGVSGANTASPFDGTPGTNNDHSSTATASITTTNANDFIIGAVGISSEPTVTQGTGYTLILTRANLRETSTEYRIVGSTGSYSPSFTLPSSSNDWAMITDAIKKAP
jgi:hypothetical protein